MPLAVRKTAPKKKPTLSDNVTEWTRPQPTRRPPPPPEAPRPALPAHLAPVPPCTPTAELVRLCGCSERTARRWKACGVMPAALAQWVGLQQGGSLGPVDAHWGGWMLRRGALISPEGWEFRPGDVLSLPLLRMQLSAQRVAARQAREAAEPPRPALVAVAG